MCITYIRRGSDCISREGPGSGGGETHAPEEKRRPLTIVEGCSSLTAWVGTGSKDTQFDWHSIHSINADW